MTDSIAVKPEETDLLPLDEALAIVRNFDGWDLSGGEAELYARAFRTVRYYAEQAMAGVNDGA